MAKKWISASLSASLNGLSASLNKLFSRVLLPNKGKISLKDKSLGDIFLMYIY